MVITNVKKYTLTEEEISAIQTILEVVKELNWEDFDSYGDFYSSSICLVDVQEMLQVILDNNGKNLEQRYSLFFFLFLTEHLFCRPGALVKNLTKTFFKKGIDKPQIIVYNEYVIKREKQTFSK